MRVTWAACAAPIVAFAVSLALVGRLVWGAASKVALDQPNARSLHSQPVPRLGGAGIFAGTFAGWALLLLGLPGEPGLTAPVWVASALLAIVSLGEDVWGIPMRWRFLAHLVAALLFAWVALVGAVPWWLLPPIVIGTVWATNLYNFMDGSDGLAGGMAAVGFCAYAVAAWCAHQAAFGLMTLCVVGAAGAFLCFNFAPARIFMGDVGSIPLGFLAASFGVFGWSRGLWPAWFPLLVFSPFWVDATVTLVARQLRGEKVWQAHRSHYYQRLVLMGWGHRRVALAEYVLMAAAAGSGLVMRHGPGWAQAALVVGWIVAYIVAMRAVDVRWKRFASRT